MRPLSVFATGLALAACSGGSDTPEPPSASAAIATAVADQSLPTETYVSPMARFDLTLPGVWKGRYIAEEKNDTTAGAHTGVEFKFVPDSGSKAPSFTLMTVRIFSRAAWEKSKNLTSGPIGSVLAERGDDVFALSLPRENPYNPGTPEAIMYDRLIISIAQGGQQVHLTLR